MRGAVLGRQVAFSAVMPCFSAFIALRDLPAWLRGPVLFSALRLFASICARLAMITLLYDEEGII